MADNFEIERTTKQNYLRDEILSGGYDPGDFKEYLDTIKEDGGSNIDIWTLDELHQVVSSYKSVLQAREQEKSNAWQSQGQWQQADMSFQKNAESDFNFGEGFDNKFEQPGQGAEKDDFGNFGGFGFEEKKVPIELQSTQNQNPADFEKAKDVEIKATKQLSDQIQKAEKGAQNEGHEDMVRPRMSSKTQGDEAFFKEKKCIKSGTTSLNGTQDLEIIISETEVVKGGLLSSSYLVYVVTVKPKGWTVRRRFDDFTWLRSHLVKQYPYMIVPPITTKTKLKKPGPAMIKRRMAFFEKFLMNCLESPEIMGNKFFEAFLRVDNDKQWKEFKKQGDKVKKPQRLEDMITADGKATIQTGPELTDHVYKAADLFLSSNSVYGKMRMLAKELQNQFDQVANTIFTMGECFSHLYNNASAFNNSVSIGASKELENVYLTLNNLMVSWGGQLVGQTKIVQDGLENFFKYSDLEGDAIKEVIKQRQVLYVEYSKQKKSLDAKRDKIAEGKSKDKSLAKEIQQLEELRDNYGFFCYETYSQINRALVIKCKHYTRNFIQFARNQNQNLSDLFTHWSDSVTHLNLNKAADRKTSIIMDRAQYRAEEKAFDVEED